MDLDVLDRPTLPSRRSARGSRTTYRLLLMRSLAVLAKHAFPHHSILKKRSLYQDRLGTNTGKALLKRGVAFAGASLGAFLEAYGCEATPSPARMEPAAALKISRYQPGQKTPFLRHFYSKQDHFTKTGSGQT